MKTREQLLRISTALSLSFGLTSPPQYDASVPNHIDAIVIPDSIITTNTEINPTEYQTMEDFISGGAELIELTYGAPCSIEDQKITTIKNLYMHGNIIGFILPDNMLITPPVPAFDINLPEDFPTIESSRFLSCALSLAKYPYTEETVSQLQIVLIIGVLVNHNEPNQQYILPIAFPILDGDKII
jgi:hypothetical protein